ncbi:MAG TPA: hypothetical protein VME19_21645 [Streptosporangiaceae bacterium]|nr:hypothetical protein [Streptosporangiaceae bacterium]
MRAPRGPRSTVLGRLLRGRRPDRNPLRRGSDRAETVMLGVLLAAFLAGAPFAARAAASWTYATSAREAQAQRAVIHQVQATLLQPATPWNVSMGGSEAEARWRAPDGQPRTAELMVPAGALAGSTVTVWTNRAGQLTDPPLEHSQVVGRADMSQALAIVILAVTLTILGWLGRRVLDRRRLAGWDADWLATGPRWSSRR